MSGPKFVVLLYELKKNLTCWWSFKIHPPGTMNVCTKAHGNRSYNGQDISVWTFPKSKI